MKLIEFCPLLSKVKVTVSPSASTSLPTGTTEYLSFDNSISTVTCFEFRRDNVGAVFGFVIITVKGDVEDFLAVT